MTTFRIFSRPCWQHNPTWPDGYEPQAVPMDTCRTLETFDDKQGAIDYCNDHNHVWRKHSDRIRFGTATDIQKRVYYASNRYEFTEV